MSAVATELAEELSTVRRPGGFFTFSTAEILAPRLIDGAGVIGLWSCLSLARLRPKRTDRASPFCAGTSDLNFPGNA
jgi:hypothetical protein